MPRFKNYLVSVILIPVFLFAADFVYSNDFQIFKSGPETALAAPAKGGGGGRGGGGGGRPAAPAAPSRPAAPSAPPAAPSRPSAPSAPPAAPSRPAAPSAPPAAPSAPSRPAVTPSPGSSGGVQPGGGGGGGTPGGAVTKPGVVTSQPGVVIPVLPGVITTPGGGGGGGTPGGGVSTPGSASSVSSRPALPVKGSCGNVKNFCNSGSFFDLADNQTSFLWECRGLNGGVKASCAVSSKIFPPANFKAVGAGCQVVRGKNTGAIKLTWNKVGSASRYEILRLGKSPDIVRAVINLKNDQFSYLDKYGTGSNIWQGYQIRACGDKKECSSFTSKIIVRAPRCD